MLGGVEGTLDYLVERAELFLISPPTIQNVTCDFFEGKEHSLFLYGTPDNRTSP